MPILLSGFRELSRELGRVSPDLKRELRQVNKAQAQALVPQVRSAYRRHFGGSGRTAGTIRALGSQRGASVAFGRARTPWAAGQEFGSNRFPQFAPWTGPGPGGRGSRGRFLFPTVRAATEDHFDDVIDAFDKFIRRAFPERGAR